MIEKNGELSIKEQCDLLSINRSSLYYQSKAQKAEKLVLYNKIDEIYTEFPYYGSRKITAVLNQRGYEISRPTTAKYMSEMGLEAIYPKKNLSKRNPEHKVYPYLLRHTKAQYPNHIWGTDITYIRLKGGFMYLAAYLDWYSRYVISWELSNTLTDNFVILALKNALQISIPEIVNSDQGSQYTGRCLDNVFTERLWRNLKYQEVYLKEYATPREARIGIGDYFNKYNTFRPHQGIGGLTPIEVYNGNFTHLDFVTDKKKKTGDPALRSRSLPQPGTIDFM
jgi:putative transposase